MPTALDMDTIVVSVATAVSIDAIIAIINCNQENSWQLGWQKKTCTIIDIVRVMIDD